MTQIAKIYAPTLCFPSKREGISLRNKGTEFKGALYRGTPFNLHNHYPDERELNNVKINGQLYPFNYERPDSYKSNPSPTQNRQANRCNPDNPTVRNYRHNLYNNALQTPDPNFSFDANKCKEHSHARAESLSTKVKDGYFCSKLKKGYNIYTQRNENEASVSFSLMGNRMLKIRSSHKKLKGLNTNASESSICKDKILGVNKSYSSHKIKAMRKLTFSKLQQFLNANFKDKAGNKKTQAKLSRNFLNCVSTTKISQNTKAGFLRRNYGSRIVRNSVAGVESLNGCISYSSCNKSQINV